jgi:hypothetical protein
VRVETIRSNEMNERYQVWFVVNPPRKAYNVEVPDLATAYIVLNSITFFVLYLPDELISSSAGGVNIWNREENEWETWHDQEGYWEWEDVEEKVGEYWRADLDNPALDSHEWEIALRDHAQLTKYIDRALNELAQ